MKTYTVISKKINPRHSCQGHNNEAWDLVLENEQGLRFETEAFMCVGGVPPRVQVHDAVLKPLIVSG